MATQYTAFIINVGVVKMLIFFNISHKYDYDS